MAEQILSPSDLDAMVLQPGDPQNLDDLSTASQFSLVYWPHQCEVIRDRIEHIVELPVAACATQVGEDVSSKSHIHNAKGNHEKTSVPQEAGKSVCHDMILSTRENFHSSGFNLFSQKMKKQGKSVSKPAEKTFQSLKGHDRAKSNSKKGERKMKERLPSKNRRLQKTRTARQDAYFGKSKFCQGQDKLQFPQPLLPEEKNRQHAAKYQHIFVSSSSFASEGT